MPAHAYGNTYYYNESSLNSLSTPDTIPIQFGSGDEHHTFGTISYNGDSDWYQIQPLRHGRVFIIVLTDNIFYSVTVYKSNIATPIYSNSYTTYSCIADVSFVVTRDTVVNAYMPTYYINISSYNGSYSPTQNYRIIVFYALYDVPGTYSNLCYPLPLNGTGTDPNLRITSSVGYRSYDYSYHIGTDIGAYYGTNIYSVADAYIKVSENHYTYGNRVFAVLNTLDPYTLNNINVRYYHLSSLNVAPQTNISKGDLIGTVGFDGLPNIYYSHLHIDFNNCTNEYSKFLQNDLAQNPYYLINIVDLFPDLTYWANDPNYVYINS